MRGLTKAAALLPSTFAHAFLVPEPAASSDVGPTKPVVKYHASEAYLSFDVDNFQRYNPFGEYRNFTIEIKSSERPCGENNITFEGHDLDSVWDGTSATGELSIPGIFPPILANWQIHCLFNTIPSDGSNSNGEDVAQVLSFGIQRTRKDLNVGFTVSYKQIGAPTVLQFTPYFNEWKRIESNVEHWRAPSPAFASQERVRTIGEEDEDEEGSTEPIFKKQKAVFHSIEAMTHYLRQQLTSFRETAAKVVQSCHTHLKNFGTDLHEAMAKLCPEHRHGQEEDDHLGTYLAESSSSINRPLKSSPDRVTEALPPSQTRSLHTSTPTTSLSSHSTSNSSTLASLSSPPAAIHFLKLVSIAFILFSLLTYTILYIRDPRRRADRAARREERRNRHLYRRAAWSLWWQTRVCALRHRSCPRSRGTGTCDTWDEKRARVLQQEEILEAVTQQDIRTLRYATRPNRNRHVNSIVAAEEGRNTFLFDSESDIEERSRRRRQSTSTLPGYESEGTQPPGYTTVIEDTPDSSVVSTSPRISRDGFGTLTDSEDGKSIDDFSLNSPRVARHDVGRVF